MAASRSMMLFLELNSRARVTAAELAEALGVHVRTVYRDIDELRERLLRLAVMPDLTRDIGDAARAYVAENRMIAYQVEPRIAWYRSLWARREALTEAMQQRLATPYQPGP